LIDDTNGTIGKADPVAHQGGDARTPTDIAKRKKPLSSMWVTTKPISSVWAANITFSPLLGSLFDCDEIAQHISSYFIGICSSTIVLISSVTSVS
jgi:hypothetical protein